MFLDGHISEVNKHVVQFTGAGCVLDCAEPAEAKLVPEDQNTEMILSLLIQLPAIFSINQVIVFVYNMSENIENAPRVQGDVFKQTKPTDIQFTFTFRAYM